MEQMLPIMAENVTQLLLQKSSIQALGIDIGDRLERLRNTIKQTRELANKIMVGVSFEPGTTLEVENPDLTKAATHTKVF